MFDEWKQLKETIKEIKEDNNYVNGDVSEVCQFLLNYMNVLEEKEDADSN